jgi:hypothetical protein
MFQKLDLYGESGLLTEHYNLQAPCHASTMYVANIVKGCFLFLLIFFLQNKVCYTLISTKQCISSLRAFHSTSHMTAGDELFGFKRGAL